MPWRANVVSTKVNFKPRGAYPKLMREQSRPESGPSKVKWAKNELLSFLGEGSLDHGALPWLISLPSPELWLRHWGGDECQLPLQNSDKGLPAFFRARIIRGIYGCISLI